MAQEREFRRSRILAMVQASWSYAAIDDADAAAGAGAKLLAKLNAVAETIKRRRELHGDAAPNEADSPDEAESTIAEAALDAPQTIDT